MKAIAWQPVLVPDGIPGHYDRHRPKQITTCHLTQQHVAAFVAQAENAG